MASGLIKKPFSATMNSFHDFQGGPSTTSDTLYIPSGYRGLLFIVDSNNTRCAGLIVAANSTGSSVYTCEMYKGSGLTFSTGKNQLTVTKSSSTVRYLAISIQGTGDIKLST